MNLKSHVTVCDYDLCVGYPVPASTAVGVRVRAGPCNAAVAAVAAGPAAAVTAMQACKRASVVEVHAHALPRCCCCCCCCCCCWRGGVQTRIVAETGARPAGVTNVGTLAVDSPVTDGACVNVSVRPRCAVGDVKPGTIAQARICRGLYLWAWRYAPSCGAVAPFLLKPLHACALNVSEHGWVYLRFLSCSTQRQISWKECKVQAKAISCLMPLDAGAGISAVKTWALAAIAAAQRGEQ